MSKMVLLRYREKERGKEGNDKKDRKKRGERVKKGKIPREDGNPVFDNKIKF